MPWPGSRCDNKVPFQESTFTWLSIPRIDEVTSARHHQRGHTVNGIEHRLLFVIPKRSIAIRRRLGVWSADGFAAGQTPGLKFRMSVDTHVKCRCNNWLRGNLAVRGLR